MKELEMKCSDDSKNWQLAKREKRLHHKIAKNSGKISIVCLFVAFCFNDPPIEK
jgi:hypothetical protein